MSRTKVRNDVCGQFIAFETPTAIKMLNIDMIREKILHYAIHDEMGNILPKMVQEVRLVKKSWLDSTNRVLQKSEESVITLDLDETNSLAEAEYVKKNGKLLDKFTASFAPHTPQLHSRLPVKLILNVGFFQKENFTSLLNFLNRCENFLREMEVIFPNNGGYMSVGLPRLTLPQLRKLTFTFSNENANNQDGDGLRAYENNQNALWFLQGILNASTELKCLSVPFVQTNRTVPEDFQFIQLPEKILSIELMPKLSSAQFQVLVSNHLPNLKQLELLVHETPFEEGLLFNILQRVSRTLTKLRLRGLNGSGWVRPSTYLRFPRMEKLKTVQILSGECKLGPGDLSALARCLPNLTDLFLLSTAEIIETNWLANSKFESVEYLNVCCRNEHFPYRDDNYYTSLSFEMMYQLHTAFPNIQRLALTVNINNLSGLTCLLKNITHLQYLGINLEGNLQDIGTISDELDSTLLGLPLKLVNALREHGDVVHPVRLRSSNMQPSIKNLLELHTLELSNDAKHTAADGRSLISSLLFSQGFLKMTKLRTLRLHSKFKLNAEMRAQWLDHGFTLIYVNT